jgi:hypothetical protein
MERVGSRNTKRILAYIRDGLLEIATETRDRTARATIDVEEDTLFYTWPTNMVNLLGVYRKYDDDGNYIAIAEIQKNDLIKDASASSTTTDDDLIVL